MLEKLRRGAIPVLATGIGAFVFYTAFYGAFESLIQRAVFTALVTTLGLLMFPLGAGKPWRPVGMVVDALMGLWMLAACGYVVWHFERIMTQLPWAQPLDVALASGTVLVILDLARRSTGSLVFPGIVALSLVYALFGDRIPGSFGHRGFDIYYLTEVIYLSDRGLWGLLVNVASTTLAAFILFGAMLLHTGAGQTFYDLSARLSGRSPGGAAKIATVASGFFGAINGSTVANVATTGNFTIPLMKRLRYPAGFAGAVEAVASTGGQLAPPIMGTAAFVMAELVNVNYWRIALAAVIPATLFYVSVFTTVHLVAKRKSLGQVDEAELPDWRTAANWRRLAPIFAAVIGLAVGIYQGRSVGLTACFGMIGMMSTRLAVSLIDPHEGIKDGALRLLRSLEEGGRGVVTVGVLLIAAQVFVGVLNLTGFGVAATSAILQLAGEQIWLIALIMALVCLIAGMGLPTSAAYVLVAAVFAPALIQQDLDPLTVHFFVLYYATLSVITPPVCVGVFIAATIAGTSWLRVAGQALRLAAPIYILPLLYFVYPGLLGYGDIATIALAGLSGLIFTLALSNALSLRAVIGGFTPSSALWLPPAGLALIPSWSMTGLALALMLACEALARRRLNGQNFAQASSRRL